MENLLTESAAAVVLNLQPQTLNRWRWNRKGPPYCKIGGAIRYCVADLKLFVAQNRVAAND